MPVWLLPSLGGVFGGLILGHSTNPAPAPDPINSATNFIIVGTAAYIAYKVFVKKA